MGGERQEEDVDVEAEVGRRDVGMIHKDEEAKREADERVDEGSGIVERWRDGQREGAGGKGERRREKKKERNILLVYLLWWNVILKRKEQEKERRASLVYA